MTYYTATQIRLEIERRLGRELTDDAWAGYYDILWNKGVHEPITDEDMDEYVMPTINFVLLMKARIIFKRVSNVSD